MNLLFFAHLENKIQLTESTVYGLIKIMQIYGNKVVQIILFVIEFFARINIILRYKLNTLFDFINHTCLKF
jgi:hypothetical protein